MSRPTFYTPVGEVQDWANLPISSILESNEYYEYAKVAKSADPADLSRIATTLARKAAAESVAIEGFYELKAGESRTIALEEDGWEQILEVQSRESVNIFTSQLDAFEYVRNVSLLDGKVTEQFIRELHQIACRAQATYEVYVPINGSFLKQDRPLNQGAYKEFPNNVTLRDGGTHFYCDPAETAIEMGTLMERINSALFTELDPIIQAAYAHYSLAQIHPFGDGNGRVARALASLFIYRACGVPFIVYADRKQAYLQALEAADNGRLIELANYFYDRTLNTLSHARQEYVALKSPTADSQLALLLSATTRHSEFRIGEVRAIAMNLFDRVSTIFQGKVDAIVEASPGEIELDKPSGRGWGAVPEPYTIAQYTHGLVRVSVPMPIEREVFVAVGYAEKMDQRYTFYVASARESHVRKIMDHSSAEEELFLRFEDVHPQLGSDSVDRITMLIDSAISRTLEYLINEQENALRQAGLLRFQGSE